MDIVICYIIIYIIEAFILWHYSSNMFTSKYSTLTECLSANFLYIVPFLSVFLENFWINTTLFLIVNYIYFRTFFDTRRYTALFHSTVTTILMATSELIVVGLISNLAYNFYNEASHFQSLAEINR